MVKTGRTTPTTEIQPKGNEVSDWTHRPCKGESPLHGQRDSTQGWAELLLVVSIRFGFANNENRAWRVPNDVIGD
jgi:hypothetical protein